MAHRRTRKPTRKQLAFIRVLESQTGRERVDPRTRGDAYKRIQALLCARDGRQMTPEERDQGYRQFTPRPLLRPLKFDPRRLEDREALRISGLVSAWEAGATISELAEMADTTPFAMGREIDRLRGRGHPFPVRAVA